MLAKTLFIFPLLLTLIFSLSSVNKLEAASLGKILRAGSKASKRAYRKSAVGKGAMTEEMIENCIILIREIETAGSNIKKFRLRVDTRKKEIDDMGVALKNSKAKINRSDANSVAAYNKKIKLYQTKVTALNSLREEYNNDVGQYQHQTKRFEKECKDQSYYQDDYDKVVKKLGYGM